MLAPMRPDRLARTLAALRRWGLTPAGACAVAAIRHPDREAIVDDRGAVSFGALQHRTNALARALRAVGVAEGDTVAVMRANHRGFIEATVAACKPGAHLLCLDTELPPGRGTDVLGGGRPAAVIHDV
jgi:acyl-CoA synthetase (AMP-forming)/AMP-acid ligase II